MRRSKPIVRVSMSGDEMVGEHRGQAAQTL